MNPAKKLIVSAICIYIVAGLIVATIFSAGYICARRLEAKSIAMEVGK